MQERAVDSEIEGLLGVLQEFDAVRTGTEGEQKDQVQVRTRVSVPPTFAPATEFRTLPKGLQDALHNVGVTNLYQHQIDAIDRARLGGKKRDLVINTATASGKTLCFNIPIILGLLEDPTAHALMIHPMKALSNDQRRQFNSLAESLAVSSGRKVESWLYDGDTDREWRPMLKEEPPSVLLTNPETLHLSFLGWAHQWEEKFLKNLRYIVIDEIHEYRGYFGSNMALLIRRFLAKLDALGVHPQLFLASATCANPEEHAERLTGRKAWPISEGRPLRPKRHFAFIIPDIPEHLYHDIYQLRIANAAVSCLSKDLATIVFCPSRKFAEDACRRARREAARYGLNEDAIRPYRSGYKAEDRREIEAGLRDGRYKVVFSTNALEIGIDIGRLDACILAGFPDNVMSAWQRIGRTGRSWDKTAFVLYYALNNPVDQFFARNIDAFLRKPLDEIIVSTRNEELIRRHLPYYLYEVGWKPPKHHRKIIGPDLWKAAKAETQHGEPLMGRGPFYPRLDIRGVSGPVYKLMHNSKTEIGSISDTQRFREAFIGAVYNHLGRSYRVKGYTADEVLLEDAVPHHYTKPSFWTVINESDVAKGYRYRKAISVYYGKLTVFENFGGYQLVDERTTKVIEQHQQNDTKQNTSFGMWLSIEDTNLSTNDEPNEGIPVLEHLLRIGAPFLIPCDRHDIDTGTTAKHPARSYFYENVPGGIGIAEKSFSIWRKVLQTGMRIAQDCSCRDGCPWCILPPRLLRGTDKLRKEAGIALANQILSLTDAEPDERFDPETYGWRPL